MLTSYVHSTSGRRGQQPRTATLPVVLEQDSTDGSGGVDRIGGSGGRRLIGIAKDRGVEPVIATVEDLLFGLDGDAGAAVIGLPDACTGESVCAVGVTAEGDRVTLEGLTCRLAAAGQRRRATPELIEIVDGLPCNPADKALERKLQPRFGRQASQDRG